MTTVLVWVLMTWIDEKAGAVQYSPPVTNLADCQLMQKNLPAGRFSYIESRCVQIRMVVPGR